MKFNEHGTYEVTVDGNIISLVTKGNWNLETTVSCIDFINSAIENMASDRFAIAVDTLEVDGITPECLSVWLDAINYWPTIGMGAVSMTSDQESLKFRVYLGNFDKALKSVVDYRYTASFKEATAWFNELGYKGFSTSSK